MRQTRIRQPRLEAGLAYVAQEAMNASAKPAKNEMTNFLMLKIEREDLKYEKEQEMKKEERQADKEVQRDRDETRRKEEERKDQMLKVEMEERRIMTMAMLNSFGARLV